MEISTDQDKRETAVSGNIKITYPENKIQIIFPPKGLRGKGLITISIIGLWLLTILIWSIFLLLLKPINVLYSIPFWAIGIFTIIKSVKILMLEQTIIIMKDSIIYRMRRGSRTDEKKFEKNNISVSMVEGQYYAYSGLNKRGQFPAIIYNNEAFGFAERYSTKEKLWLIDFINRNS